jgi:hypothetical protein
MNRVSASSLTITGTSSLSGTTTIDALQSDCLGASKVCSNLYGPLVAGATHTICSFTLPAIPGVSELSVRLYVSLGWISATWTVYTSTHVLDDAVSSTVYLTYSHRQEFVLVNSGATNPQTFCLVAKIPPGRTVRYRLTLPTGQSLTANNTVNAWVVYSP